MNNSKEIRLCSITRHRMGIDGKGIRTLVHTAGCPLKCQYCINPIARGQDAGRLFTDKELYENLYRDNVYFCSTGGGITFSGGEPALHYKFICRFIKKYCKDWSTVIETSLNVPEKNVRALIPVIDEFIVDIKSWNSEVYETYTEKKPTYMRKNLELLEKNCPEKVLVRIPLIPDYNTQVECNNTAELMKQKGFKVDVFKYILPKYD